MNETKLKFITSTKLDVVEKPGVTKSYYVLNISNISMNLPNYGEHNTSISYEVLCTPDNSKVEEARHLYHESDMIDVDLSNLSEINISDTILTWLNTVKLYGKDDWVLL